jgi:uncharacterized membrane protein YfcA
VGATVLVAGALVGATVGAWVGAWVGAAVGAAVGAWVGVAAGAQAVRTTMTMISETNNRRRISTPPEYVCMIYLYTRKRIPRRL